MAVSPGGIPAELQEGITAFLGTKKILLVKRVQLLVKSKYDDYILVLTPWRAYVLLVILPVRVHSSFSFLEVQEITVRESSLVVIETDTSSYAFRLMSFDDLEQVVIHVTMSLKKVFPDSSPGTLLKNSPPNLYERIRRITDSLEEMLQSNQGPCGGFSETYAALCDYNGFTFREEIQWDVDNIYHSQDCREFNLLDFSHLESRDVALSVAALSFNLWFTKLYCKDFRLNLEISEQLLYMLSKSVTLEELVLENSGLKSEFAQRMAQALSRHPDSVLHTINLAGNQLEDRGIIAFSQHFEKRLKGLQSLNLARTSLTAKGMSTLCQALAANKAIGSSLRYLDLSGNPSTLAVDDTSSLQSLLCWCSSLSHLSLSGTDCSLDTIFGALAHGCCTSLVHLDLSKNVYSHKRVKDVSPAIKQFFSKASALRHVSLAGTKLPPDAVRALLQGLAYNSCISDLHLDLSSCELRSAGAQVIQDLISDANSVSDLDLSDNGFDSDMVTLVLSIGRSKSIRHVSLGKNFNIKSKDGLVDVLHRIVQITQEDDCALQSLSVAESRLKLGTNVLLSALGSNTSLIALDISGNAMGDTGAKMLAKALQINTKLRTVVWDRNNTTGHGLLEVAQALERNYTLKSMPLPMNDVVQAYRSNPEKTEEAVHKIQSCLTRNQMRRTLPTQTFRLQQGILTTSSEQMVNEICLSVQKHVDILSSCLGREVEADILFAEEAIRNANLSVSILPLLYEAGNTPYQNGKLQHKMECLTEEASQACGREIQAIMQAVLDTVHSLCPAMVQKRGVRDQLVNAMSERIYLQDHLNLSSVLDQMVTDVFSKLNEIKLSVTAAVADCIVDAVLGDLTVAQCKLAESLPKHGLDLPSLQLESVEDDAAVPMRGRNPLDIAEKGFAAEEYKMALRRKNKHFRSIRPTPTMRSLSELELQASRDASGLRAHRAPLSLSPAAPKARPASTKDAEPASGLLPCMQPASTESLMDLPTEGEKLEHCTKARPRPNRRHKQPPSKPNVQPVACENSEDRSITRVDEGLEDFFSKKLITEELPPTALETCPGSALLASSSSRTLKKKIGNFFAFKKPKSSRGSRCEKEPEGSVTASKSRRSVLSDILRTPSKAGEPLSKSEEGGLAAESGAEPEHSQTPNSARRIRPKYSREGKSQSLILLSGEDEDALGVRHDKKRHLEKSDGELPSSFEQRVHIMLHRMGVTKGLAAEGKKQQNKDSEIKKAGSDGDIVDSSADSPPPSLKVRTHSMSTDTSLRSSPDNMVEPGIGSAAPRPAWKALGKQLNSELKGKSSDLPRSSLPIPEQSGQPELTGREGWSSSLPRLGRSTPTALLRRVSHCGEPGTSTIPLSLPAPPDAEDNRLTPRLAALSGTSRRAVSIHEDQLREPDSLTELENAMIPLRLRRSPVLKRRNKRNSLVDPEVTSEPSPSLDTTDAVMRDQPGAEDTPEELQPGAEAKGDQPQAAAQTVVNAQDSTLDQRSPVPGQGEPALGQ
ncbi:capping protein, Arp2/3 and myosin-I linker protein 2 isoform X2 [Apteryx rowi]|uniref:capping protein, Arp2/3 and myosin-I linker protein 2 isoform X2 n=1 Tax=Apteryx rowi TaxID=308060 RepID=UPI000E1DFF83|nr:capping protein, Arp2/3 and myosin-I linker protein 2 isoform X2 [Apteryx rowi]